jgi:phage gp36-like protein
MSDISDLQNLTFEQATPEDVTEMIAELEQYRERLVNESMTAAQRAKLMKSQVQSNLDPALAEIDAILGTLREKQASFANH